MIDGIGVFSKDIKNVLSANWLAVQKADHLLREYLTQTDPAAREKFVAALVWTLLMQGARESFASERSASP